jgi:hypothetical protein
MTRTIFRTASVALAAASLACSDAAPPSAPAQPGFVDESTGLIVSDPGVSPSPGNNASVVFVSAQPGTFPTGLSVTIRNETSGKSPINVRLSAGGFDPVAVEARAGDHISREVEVFAGDPIPRAVTTAPGLRNPQIVRTSPDRTAWGIPLDATIEIVFSEPINQATITSESVSLSQNGLTVGSSVSAGPDMMRVQLVPVARFLPETAYSFLIDARVADLDGDRLLESSVVSFMTTFDDTGVETPLDMSSELSFISDRDGNTELYRGRLDGSNVIRLTRNTGFDGEAAWSPDGKLIAFASARQRDENDRLIDDVDIYLMAADGTGVVRLTTTGSARQPTWSPDGRFIAYEYDPYPNGAGDIAIIDVSVGESSRRYLGLSSFDASEPVWSPDGSRIAFVDKAFDIRAVTPDGKSVTTLLKSAPSPGGFLSFRTPSWSPDGRRVAAHFCRGSSDECDRGIGIVTSSVDAFSFGYLVDDEQVWPSRLAWSLDGEIIAFERGWCEGNRCGADIDFVTLDRRKRGRIFGDARDPAWRPAIR